MSTVRALTVSVVNRVPGPFAAPFRSGGLLARTVAPVLERFLPTDLTEVVVRSGPARGLRLLIDVQREKYYWTGAHERSVQDALEVLLRPGDVVWDIGAHIGFFSLLASRLVGVSGAVVAFEPVVENRLRLRRSLTLNGAVNVCVRGEAVAGQTGTAVLHARGSSSMWTLQPGEVKPSSSVVECITLDDLARAMPTPKLIKVDVEGLELDVLQGAQRLLRDCRPTLVIEISDSFLINDCLAVAEGYAARRLDNSHWILRWIGFRERCRDRPDPDTVRLQGQAS
jgi:FkbM family methyltransferase